VASLLSLSPQFSSSSGSVGHPPSFLSTQSVEGFIDYDNAVSNAAQKMLQANLGQVLKLMIECEVDWQRLSRMTKDKVLRMSPVARGMFCYGSVEYCMYEYSNESIS